GGCQSLHTDSMDETLGLPTEQAVTVALRTQQILAHETGVTRVTDPLGGSWFIEHLTDTMESGALDYIADIDAMGEGGARSEAKQRNSGSEAKQRNSETAKQAASGSPPVSLSRSLAVSLQGVYAPR